MSCITTSNLSEIVVSDALSPQRSLQPAPLPIEVAQAYLQHWNNHDGDAVGALFAPGGTYVDPCLQGPLPREEIATYVAGLVAAFPDLTFVTGAISVDGERVIAQWRMRGTNTGPLRDAEPTGRTCDLLGVDVITVGPEGIISVVGYFDQKTLIEQLGVQILLVPQDEWPMHYGSSSRTDLGNITVPGAITMTWIQVDTDEEQKKVRLRGSSIVAALAAEPGLIGFLEAFSDHRGHTLAAWTSAQAAEAAIARCKPHHQAMDQVFTGELAGRLFTSVWVPYRLNDQLARCPACAHLVRIPTGAKTASCQCGAGRVQLSSYI